jgi:hypothetical protein
VHLSLTVTTGSTGDGEPLALLVLARKLSCIMSRSGPPKMSDRPRPERLRGVPRTRRAHVSREVVRPHGRRRERRDTPFHTPRHSRIPLKEVSEHLLRVAVEHIMKPPPPLLATLTVGGRVCALQYRRAVLVEQRAHLRVGQHVVRLCGCVSSTQMVTCSVGASSATHINSSRPLHMRRQAETERMGRPCITLRTSGIASHLRYLLELSLCLLVLFLILVGVPPHRLLVVCASDGIVIRIAIHAQDGVVLLLRDAHDTAGHRNAPGRSRLHVLTHKKFLRLGTMLAVPRETSFQPVFSSSFHV